jgi:hypothetical protein
VAMRRTLSFFAVAAASLALAPAALAQDSLTDPVDQWLPSLESATWTYEWSNSGYSPVATKEQYTVKQREQTAFRLAWTTEGLGNPAGAARSQGEIDYRRTDAGLVNLNWASTPPPPEYPILCAGVANCANSLAGMHYLVIWGNRSPVLAEPLVRGARWSSVGGANSEVSSASRYLGREKVVVHAFPDGVTAAVVESDVTQAGAIGDPFGSGVRTVWWVRGVGPVKVLFRHGDGSSTRAELLSTNLVPRTAPSDHSLLPLNRGDSMRLRWRNSRHMRRWSTQRLTVAEVVNNTARVDVRDLSGPIRVRGAYVFSSRLSGVTNVSGFTRAATRADLPELGPRSLPRDRRRRFFTPFDLMVYGFNPVVPAYARHGQTWIGQPGGRDYKIFGVRGRSVVVGTHRVRTPLGRLRTVVVESRLRQKGYPFGSGQRTMYFAPDRGLVKLVFRHRDGSVSTVERLR